MCSDSTSPEVIEDEWKTADTWRDHSSSKRNLVRTTRRWDTNCHPDDTRPFDNDDLRPSTKPRGCGVHEANGRPNIFLSLQMIDGRAWPSIMKRQEILRIGDPDKIKTEKTEPIYRARHSGNCGWRCWRLTVDVRFPLWCDVVDWRSSDNLWTIRKRQSVQSYIKDLFPFKSVNMLISFRFLMSNKSGEASLAFCCVSTKTRDPPFLKLNVMSGISEMSFQRKKQSSSWWTNVNGKENDARIWKSP